MIIGVPKETKAEENRVSLTPAGVEVLKRKGHSLLVEKAAGMGSGFEDDAYENPGAEIVDTPMEIFGRSEMVLRVKEPQPHECEVCGEDRSIFPIFTWQRRKN